MIIKRHSISLFKLIFLIDTIIPKKVKPIQNLLVTLLGIFLLASCSFNSKFFYPSKLPKANFYLTTKFDTAFVNIDKTTFQPTYLKNKKDTIKFDYTIESVIFTSTNGNKLNGWILKPRNQKIIGTLLHFHGSGANLFFHSKVIAPLIKYGFQIFTFDYSEFGYSEGIANRKNTLADAFSALDYVKKREDMKNTKLIFYGQSYGGHLATVVASQRQNEIDGLVLEGAFSSHRDEASYTVPFWGNIVRQGICAKNEIKKYHKQLLIIHSKEDKRTPLYMGKKIFDNANSPKEFYEVDKPHIEALQFYSNEISIKIKKMCNIK